MNSSWDSSKKTNRQVPTALALIVTATVIGLWATEWSHARVTPSGYRLSYVSERTARAAPVKAVPSPSSLPRVARQISDGEPVLIVAFGSSSTEGVGASAPAAAYPGQLETALRSALQGQRITVLNRGVGGDNAPAMMQRLERDVLSSRPDLVIWQTGSNDPMSGISVEQFEAETRRGVGLMRAAGADVILMEPQRCPALERIPGALAYRDVVRKLGGELQVPVVRRYDLMNRWIRDGELTGNQVLSADGLHMADAGYAKLAYAVAAEILGNVTRSQTPRTAGVLSADPDQH